MRHGHVLVLALVLVAVAVGTWLWRQQARKPREATPALAAAPAIAIPDAVAEWTAATATVTYDPDTIYDYIDGHAEVYRAYGMTRCLSRRFTGPAGQPDLVVDVFELASPEDAFGVFTHDRDGEAVALGREGQWRDGWLSFWQDRYFVSILVEGDAEPARQAAFELGRSLATALPAEGAIPAIVAALPATALEPRSVRFLRHPQILNTHLFVADENVFGLAPDTSAALGTYRHADGRAHLLLVDYPDATRAEAAAARVRTDLLGGSADGEPVRAGDRGYLAVRVRGSRLAAVLGAATPEAARATIAGLVWE